MLTGPIADAMRSSRSRDVISLQDANIIAIRTQKSKHWKQRYVTIESGYTCAGATSWRRWLWWLLVQERADAVRRWSTTYRGEDGRRRPLTCSRPTSAACSSLSQTQQCCQDDRARLRQVNAVLATIFTPFTAAFRQRCATHRLNVRLTE